ncbi:NlpC/P60 family protein [Tamaricihabitans halophyticus]|uniref:NlpC/P60 family protein n=1 Tax=Tamaricihabitans halophyticus TaxID=1262583 RepID=A0A4R2QJI3_9PSEU|nr:C40 family peptidase [Tamaricihabitans halophyticus]TCP48648.1 NlpC/P60 family protein [Tamaricihabitans halophyticus]
MRRGVGLGIIIVALCGVVLAVGAFTTIIAASNAGGQTSDMSCEAVVGPTDPGQPGAGAQDAAQLDPEQREIVSLIVSIGKERELSPRAWQVAIQAGMTESGLRNLNYGDRDSLGIFQMRPSMGWGTVAQVTDPPYQVNKFYDVLEELPDWKSMRPGDAAQAVERSAFPDRYHEWEPMAVHLLGNIGDIEDPAGCGPGAGNRLPAPTEAAGAAIEFALREQGKPYVWGATGPDSYDCSGLLLRAYEAAGVTIPRVSRDQFNGGAMLPVKEAQPGDLVFWASDTSNPATIHHVAMYLGNGKIVEAQQSGVPVHTRDFNWDEDGLMAEAVRPGV